MAGTPAEFYDLGDGEPAAPRSRSRGLGVAAVVAVVAVLLGIVAVREPGTPTAGVEPTGPAATPEPAPDAPDTLDVGGFGPVRLGQTSREYREAACGGVCPHGPPMQVAYDETNRCELRELPIGERPTLPRSWAWVRDDTVVSVGISLGHGPTATPVWPDMALGEPLGREDPRLSGWEWDGAAPVAVARTTDQGVVTTLADIDRDGSLDYATVATASGEACQLPDDHLAVGLPTGEVSTIDDAALHGLALGMPVEEASRLPGWTVAEGMIEDAYDGCRVFFRDGGGYGVAFVRDVVIGLAAQAVAGGPHAGQSVVEAQALLQDERTSSSVVTQPPEGGPHIRAVTDTGVPLTVWLNEWRVVAGLDEQVRQPDDARVDSVLLGRECGDPYP